LDVNSSPIDLISFPFNDKKSNDPYDKYITSNRISDQTREIIA